MIDITELMTELKDSVMSNKMDSNFTEPKLQTVILKL